MSGVPGSPPESRSEVWDATGDRRPGLVRATWFTNAGFAVLTLREDLAADQLLAGLLPATVAAIP